MKEEIVEPTVIPMIPEKNGLPDGQEVDYMFTDMEIVKVKEIRDYESGSELSSLSQLSDLGEEESETQSDRATWGGQVEFLLTCVGYAVGLGNVWRFPYLCYKNGGGAFLIPYTIMLAVVGLPLFYMEMAMGQFSSLGPISVWRINPLFKGLGYGMVITSWLIGLYYNVVIAHTIYYFFASMTSELPWLTCDNVWNTNSCLPYDFMMPASTINTTYLNLNLSMLTNSSVSLTTMLHTRTPSEEYYRYHVLQETESIDDFGGISWKLALCLLAAWIVVLVVLIRGIQSLGKVVYFTAIFPYLMLTILFIRGVTLDGAADGLLYYFRPDFSRLADPRVWSDAATQIFFSLSACSGGMIAMASYNKFRNNCYRDAVLVALINCGTSIFAGMVIFSILGFMAKEKGVNVADVADGGPGLAFVVYPEAIARMPVSPLWSVFFFLMMMTLGFGSEFSIVECVLSAITDEFWILQNNRRISILFRVAMVTVCFLLGLPMVCGGGMYILNLIDSSVGGFPLLFIGLFEVVAINWIYGLDRFSIDIEMMIGYKPNIYWKVCWKYVSPLVITVTILFNAAMFKDPVLDGKEYPTWALALGWLIVLFPLVVIPGWFAFRYCMMGGWKLLKINIQPLPEWGPKNLQDRDEARVAEMEVRYTPGASAETNSAFAKLMGSNISNATTLTSVTASNLTLGPAQRTINVSLPNTACVHSNV